MPASTLDTANLWTAQEREAVRASFFTSPDHKQLLKADATVAALIEGATHTLRCHSKYQDGVEGSCDKCDEVAYLLAALGGEK